MINIVAVDYKGKHFILTDKNCVTDFDYVDEYVDVEKTIKNNLENHVRDCIYYGIPAYIGENKELKEKIARTTNSLQTNPTPQER